MYVSSSLSPRINDLQSSSDLLKAHTRGTGKAQRPGGLRDDQGPKLLEALASDYKSDKDLVSTRVPGTCEWFFKDDRFLEWRDSNVSRLLWVSAGPGCGKSVLARALIDERRVCTNIIASNVCYFFFKDGQEQHTRGADALSALLHQLFENPTLITHALPSFGRYGEKLRDEFSELWEILVKCAQDSKAGEIICILDALDECEENARNQLLEKLTRFFTFQQGVTFQNPSLKLKFLITSRPYDDLEQKFQRLLDVSTNMRLDGDEKSQQIGQEINLVIDAKVPHITGGFDDKNRKRISDRLKEMDNRTYLWLFLTIDIIEKSPSRFRRNSDIDSLLSSLPSEISDVYERILSRSGDEDKARILFDLILAARWPLSLEEANMALTIATRDESCKSQRALELWPLKSFTSTVQNMCGLFVSVHDGKLFLIHQTAREFLIKTSKSASTHSHKWNGCLDMAGAHGTMSRICLDYLNFQDVASIHQSHEKSQCYLLNYAANNWVLHYTSQHAELAKDSQKAAEMLCSPSLPQGYWLHIHYGVIRYIKSAGWTKLGIACVFGLANLAEEFLNEGADINAQGGLYGNALQAASFSNNDQIIRMLLDQGADVNVQGGGYGNALQAASFEGHEKVMQILLDQGADVNAQGGPYDNALQAASAQGHKKVMQMLLDQGADVNAQGEHFRNALQAASEEGNDQIIRMLLDQGADVNAQDEDYGNALQVASFEGHEKVVQMLIDQGADVNAQGGDYGNALQAASAQGHEKVVQMLLDQGADVNAQGGDYGNALQAASFEGHEKVMQILLDQGADVNAQGGPYDNALQAASAQGHKKVMQMLLDQGADVNAQGEHFRNALQAASEEGNDQIIRMLLDQGADVNAQDEDYGNALQVASFEGHEKVVQMLIDQGADVNAQGGDYGNALQAASAGGHDHIVQMLQKAGASA